MVGGVCKPFDVSLIDSLVTDCPNNPGLKCSKKSGNKMMPYNRLTLTSGSFIELQNTTCREGFCDASVSLALGSSYDPVMKQFGETFVIHTSRFVLSSGHRV